MSTSSFKTSRTSSSIARLLKVLTCMLCLLVFGLSSWVGLQLRHTAYSSLPPAYRIPYYRNQPVPTTESPVRPASSHIQPPLERTREVQKFEGLPPGPIPAAAGPNNGGPPPTPTGAGPNPSGYVVALSFSEQLESGMYDLQQLADLAHSWQLQVVEPYIHNSQFSFPTLPHNGKLLRLGEAYDIDDFNSNLRDSFSPSYDPITPLEEVVKEVRRARGVYLVVLRLVPFTLSTSSCASSDIAAHIDTLNSHLGCTTCQQEVGVVCINVQERNNFRELLKSHPLMRKIQSRVSDLNFKIVILIPNWHGIRPHRDKFFYWDPSFDSKSYNYKYVHATKHSAMVQSAARDFSLSLHLTPPTLGIHFRLERLIKAKSFKKEDLKKCLSKVESTVRLLQKTRHINSSVLFRDYGRSGSNTCQQATCVQFAKDMKLDQGFKALGVKVQEYAPKSRSLRKEHGFSANVEQEVLARADYVVTIGYGSFQRGIVDRWSRYKAERGESNLQQERIFKLCGS